MSHGAHLQLEVAHAEHVVQDSESLLEIKRMRRGVGGTSSCWKKSRIIKITLPVKITLLT